MWLSEFPSFNLVKDSSIVLVFPEHSLGSVSDLIDEGGAPGKGNVEEKLSQSWKHLSFLNLFIWNKGRFPHGLPEPAVALIVRDVLLALQYLHEKVSVKNP